MKVSVYKGLEGTLSVLVQASVGRGLSPVMIPGITLDNIQEKVRPVVDQMRGPRRPSPGEPPQ